MEVTVVGGGNNNAGYGGGYGGGNNAGYGGGYGGGNNNAGYGGGYGGGNNAGYGGGYGGGNNNAGYGGGYSEPNTSFTNKSSGAEGWEDRSYGESSENLSMKVVELEEKEFQTMVILKLGKLVTHFLKFRS